MDASFSSSSEQSPTRNINRIENTKSSKKRKANRSDTTEQPAKAAKNTEIIKATSATGFLFDGDFKEDQKFACVSCLRGHRTHTCTHAREGRPVIGPLERGRPSNEEERRMSAKKCLCLRWNPCICERRSYLLKEVIVDNEMKWRIDKKVISNNRGEILRGVLTVPGQGDVEYPWVQ